MTIEGVDFSFGRPGGAALAAAGKRFVLRYITGAGKALTAAEITDYQAHGLDIGLIFESTANRALAGYAAGVNDAKSARTAMKALGIPVNVAIYFAVDFDVTLASQMAAIDDYLNGAHSVVGDWTGVYAEYAVIEHVHAANPKAWLYQTYAWSGGKVSSHAHLLQYRNGQTINGAAVDYDRALQANFGQWPSGVPDTSTGGSSVAEFIAAGGLDLASDYCIDLKAGTKLYKDETTVGTTLGSDATVDYLGQSSGFYFVRVTTGAFYTDSTSRETQVMVKPTEFAARPRAKTEAELQATAGRYVTATDCATQVKAATDPLNAQIATLTADLATAKAAQAKAEADAVTAKAAEQERIALASGSAEADRIRAL